jgi:hypothetical protein
MIPKKITALLILFAFGAVSADGASAQNADLRGHGFNRGGGGHLYGRGGGFHGRGVGVWGFVDDYGYDSGSPDWYGISSGYDPCPLFRQRVRTPDGWRVRMVPVC